MTNQVQRYRKKPVTVLAIQWDGDAAAAGYIVRALGVSDEVLIRIDRMEGMVLIVPTLEGEMVARVGDYIIKGVKGEVYPCKPDIFEMTYERVDEVEGE